MRKKCPHCDETGCKYHLEKRMDDLERNQTGLGKGITHAHASTDRRISAVEERLERLEQTKILGCRLSDGLYVGADTAPSGYISKARVREIMGWCSGYVGVDHVRCSKLSLEVAE